MSAATIAILVGGATVANALWLSPAVAQERRRVEERRGEERRGEERRVEERFASSHWVYDTRFNHRHYYPAIGYALPTLPGSRIAISFGSRHLFFNAGVWFEPARGGFVVVAPPFGAVAPVLPPAYVPILANGVTYYYANETYYAPAPGGYAVVAPPQNIAPIAAQGAPYPQPAPPPPAPAAPAPSPAVSAAPQGGVWYFCASSKDYYPYVTQCAEGWKTVPSTPPSAPSQPR
jgi:hypothetical protein